MPTHPAVTSMATMARFRIAFLPLPDARRAPRALVTRGTPRPLTWRLFSQKRLQTNVGRPTDLANRPRCGARRARLGVPTPTDKSVGQASTQPIEPWNDQGPRLVTRASF